MMKSRKKESRIVISGIMLLLLGVMSSVAVGATSEAYPSVFVASDKAVVESVETFVFRSASEQRRAIMLSRQLRCPQCQNQNLIESNSPVARDLRLVVYKMVNEGSTDSQIIAYMTSRFSDFVLYKPRVTPNTYILWGGPFALLLIFSVIVMVTVRSRAKCD